MTWTCYGYFSHDIICLKAWDGGLTVTHLEHPHVHSAEDKEMTDVKKLDGVALSHNYQIFVDFFYNFSKSDKKK